MSNNIMRKKFSPQQKAAVVKAVLKGDKTLAEISSQYEVHATQIAEWKKIFEDNLTNIFGDRRSKEGKTKDQLIDELYKTIGQRDIELAWLKKKVGLEP